MFCGLGVVVLGQELSTEVSCVGDAKSASAFGIDVEEIVEEGVVGNWVKIAELVVNGGEVLAGEIALGVSMMKRWKELNMSHGGVDFLGGLVVRSSKEGIRNAVAFAGAGLAWSDIFLGEDGGEDGVVSADGEVLPVEVRAPDCEGVNHDEEFLLAGGVIHLRGKELLACEGDRVFARWSLGMSGRVLDGGGLGGVAGEMLRQYGSDGEVGGVSGDIKMASGVGDLEDRGRGDGLLEALGGRIWEIGDVDGCVGGVGEEKEVGVECVWHVAVQPRDEGGGGGNETMVGIEGLVDMAVEVVGVEEVGEGVLLEAAVEEGVVCAVEVGVVCAVEVGVVCTVEVGVVSAVVMTVMEGMVPSVVVMRSHKDNMLAFMSSREAVTEVWKLLSAWTMAERSGVAVFAGGCSPARLRAMLSTESVRMSDMLMEDAVMSAEEGMEEAA
ncbi:hypothetical protein CBR_g46361 [Chara braunii]|uniref:Uncharacterized protein n=1 Tax=Chara braunii TaxID=69332 RepID=A0A388M091_CHABU|nr:hypothetical protein CBR_g46361 [Chara braunii]|eukprot:GBG87990.1 hypothetical protein CBR_g46361 [Chara braunii]